MHLDKKILFQICACLLALSVSAYFICNLVWENFGFPLLFWLAPAFFLLNGIALAVFVKKFEKNSPNSSLLLAVKMPKFIAGLIFIVAAFVLCYDRMILLLFCIFFMVIYLFYLIYESLVLLKLNKNKS